VSGLEKVRTMLAERRAEQAAQLRAAKAASPGKEPFSLDALQQHMDLRGALGGEIGRDLLAADLEREYYLRFPEVKTLADFAVRKLQAATWA
jgi:hypothetical protein